MLLKIEKFQLWDKYLFEMGNILAFGVKLLLQCRVPWDSVEQNVGIFQRAPGPVARKDIKCSIYIYFVNIGETVFSIELVSFRDGFQLNSEQIIIGYQNLEKIEKLQNAIIVIE